MVLPRLGGPASIGHTAARRLPTSYLLNATGIVSAEISSQIRTPGPGLEMTAVVQQPNPQSAAAVAQRLFADIVFDRPMDQAFTYGVPDSLHAAIGVGRRVDAPFGRGAKGMPSALPLERLATLKHFHAP